MVRKLVLLIIICVTLLLVGSCGGAKKGIEFYQSYDAQINKLSEKIEGTISSNAAFYVLLKNDQPFSNTSISVNISKYNYKNARKDVVSGSGVAINPEDTTVVIPLSVNESGTYEVSFFFDKPEEPIMTKNFIIE